MVEPSKKVWRFNYRMLLRIMTGMNDEAKVLLRELQLPCDLVDRTGTTLIQYSLKYRNPEMLQHLIEIGHSIEIQDSDGFTPFVFAINNDDVSSIGVLLKFNTNIHCIERNGMSFLQVAVRRRLVSNEVTCLRKISHSIFDLFIDRVNRDFLTNNCKIPPQLCNADNLIKLAIVAYGNVELAKFILENNYAIDYFLPKQKLTALHWAIIFGKIENAKLLIRQGANVGLLHGTQHSPLYYYTYNFERVDKQSEVLKLLIKAQSKCGFVASELEPLLSKGTKDTVRALLNSDIDVFSMKFKNGLPLLHILMRNENFADFDFFAKLFMKVDINLPSYIGTPLENAVRSRCPKTVEILLQYGANVNERDGSSTVIFYACNSYFSRNLVNENASVKIVELLLQYGADVQIVSYGGKTILDMIKSACKGKILGDIIIAHLALLDSLDHVILIDCIRDKIESDPTFKSHFDLCTREIKELKDVVVYGTVTLLTLLAEKIEKIMVYARYQRFALAFNCAMKKVTHVQPYYLNSLQEKVKEALYKCELDEKAAAIIATLTGLCRDAYYTIIYKIISYLNLQDLKNLCEAEPVIVTVK